MSGQSPPEQQQQPVNTLAEYETGVSNGDVDWLFRGKSKKLTKKMNSQNPSVSAATANSGASDKERKQSIDEHRDALNKKRDSAVSQAASTLAAQAAGASGAAAPSPLAPASGNSKTISPVPTTSSSKGNHLNNNNNGSTTPASTLKPSSADVPSHKAEQHPVEEKVSKLDIFKIGRSRSSSESSQTQPSRRRSSVGFIPTPSPPQNNISPKNSVKHLSVSSAGSGNSVQSDTPSVSRSGSTSKRSLFSSISSKFKGSGQNAGLTASSSSNSALNGTGVNITDTFVADPTSTSVVDNTRSRSDSGPGLSPTDKTHGHHGHPLLKPQLNLLGVSSNNQGSNQDLIAMTNKPPDGIPKRRTSSSSNSSSSKQHQHQHQNQLLAKNLLDTQLQDPHSKKEKPSVPLCTINDDKFESDETVNVNLRRVTFAIDKLAFDPQQQIPSRRPKKGNVLIPEDLVAAPPRLSQGISLSDGKNPIQVESNKFSEKELAQAIEAQKKALIEAAKHAHEAHFAAKRIANEVAQYKVKLSSKDQKIKSVDYDEEELAAERDAEADRLNYSQHEIEIDKPLHVHENYFPGEENDELKRTSDDVDDQDIIDSLSLETIYTRCCHLREILPIPATLKQLKNKSKPLQVLKLLNPKPTLIDVLSFSDFIAITPINTIIFDNVTMTTEMLKHFLSSLVYNRYLEKLSLRNVAMDEIGWKYLCQFLSKNKIVKKLDISQQRIKPDTPASLIRSSMDWPSFIEALVERGGLEELVINGCKLTDEIFTELIEKAANKTYRLGIAAIELNLHKAQVVADWIGRPESRCVGVDIAFNNLNGGLLKPFINSFNKGNQKLLFFSLNSTKLNNVEEVGELLRSLTNVKLLRFLDLLSLPDLFPGIISRLNKYLPMLKDLRRIHFDLNDLTPQSIGAIADILPKCEGLFHVSFLGNRNLDHGAAGVLYTAVKMSKSLFTLDLDYDLVSDELSQRMAFYLMRNMDITMNSDANKLYIADPDNDEELMFDGSLLMETAEKLIAANDKENKEDPKIQRLITNALIERTRAVRKDIHKTIDTLFLKRTQGTLTLEGKETLLRFCLLDSSLEKVFHMFEEHAKNNAFGGQALSPSPSVEGGIDGRIASDNAPSTTGPAGLSKVARNNSVDVPTTRLSPPSPTTTGLGSNVLKSIGNALNLNMPLHDTLHESSSEMITAGPILSPHNTADLNNQQGYFTDQTFQPHTVVVDSSSDGKDVPIDYLTGRPVLMRSISQTSAHAKEQEEEEGELHKFGFYMQQRNSQNDVVDDAKNVRDIPTLNVLPSGSELRDAIITAKGIESVTDLIDNINNNRVSLDRIYNISDLQDNSTSEFNAAGPPNSKIAGLSASTSNASPSASAGTANDPSNSPDLNDVVSIDSMGSNEKNGDSLEGHDVNAVVDEVYDKLLNDAQRVRSNKQE